MGMLFDNLQVAGIPVTFADDSTGRVSFDAMTQDQRRDAGKIIDAYLEHLESGSAFDLADILKPTYSISPKSELVAAGETLEITVTGAAGDYILIIEGLEVPEQNITIDETGVEVIELPAIDAGIYKIKGTGALSLCVAKVEVI